jgi:uncharacterized protein
MRADPEVARLLLLQGQGLLADPERPATPRHVLATIRQLGFVQVDSISTVERAHHLTLAARHFGYRSEALRKLVEDQRLAFENWTHDAAIIPTEWFPHWHHRFDQVQARMRASGWWRSRFGTDPDLMLREVEQRIRAEGPVLARDFQGEAVGEKGWWGWKPAKAALELLWRSGRLSVARRVNFQKVYDLTERVLPGPSALPAPPHEEHVAWVCQSALQRLGFATATELTAYWSAIDRQEIRRWIGGALERGELLEVHPGTYALPDWQKRAVRMPSPPDIIRLLSPFDPVVRDRKRALRLFGFDFHFEAFLPQPRRQYGYYVLPILERDRLVGRIEPKHHRDAAELEVRGLWWEPGIRPTRKRQAQLREALERLRDLVGARHIVWRERNQSR